MSFSRAFLPQKFPQGDELTSLLIGIGIRLNGRAKRNGNIEDLLVSSSLEGLAGDGRLLSLLIDWLEVHSARINADRLVKVIITLKSEQDERFIVFWAAIAQWLANDIRFAKLRKLAPKTRFDFLEDRTDFLIQKHGEDVRFQKTCLRVPDKVFRHRLDDILSPEELAKIHTTYRFRILLGPSYRADMWAKLSQNPELSNAELARICYGSYPTAFAVKKDFFILVGKMPELKIA